MNIAIFFPSAYSEFMDYFRPIIFPDGRTFDGIEFHYNPDGGAFDGVIVYQSVAPLDVPILLRCPPTRTLCVLLEPPDIIVLPDAYTRQFYAVAGPFQRMACAEPLLTHAGCHWFVEITAAQANQTPILSKPKLISAVTSSKRGTKGHRIRWALMVKLKEHFGDRLDWYGRGVRDTGAQKLPGLADYKYHIVLENGVWPHYWTEKVADAFVANCFPFYWGAPNLGDYFDPASFETIDARNPDMVIDVIEKAINADLWTHRQAELANARQRVTNQYHPYAVWSRLLQSLPQSEPREIVIKPHNNLDFSFSERQRFRLRRLKSELLGAIGH